MPVMADSLALVRSAHRVLAVLALTVVLAMVVVSLQARPRWRLESLEALALLGVTLFLAILGPFTARSVLPAVALGNLLGGFAMLALCVRLAAPGRVAGSLRLRAWLFAIAVLIQVMLGCLASTTQSVLSCSSLNDCESAARGQSWAALSPWQAPGSAPGAPVQWLHRVWTWVVIAAGVPLAWRLIQHDSRAVAMLLACLFLQAVLGQSLAGSDFAFALVLAHNLLAALMLALAVRWL